MNNVRDAYEPPVSTIRTGRRLRVIMMLLVLLAASGAAIYTGLRVRHEAKIREWNSNRGPAPSVIDRRDFDTRHFDGGLNGKGALPSSDVAPE